MLYFLSCATSNVYQLIESVTKLLNLCSILYGMVIDGQITEQVEKFIYLVSVQELEYKNETNIKMNLNT